MASRTPALGEEVDALGRLESVDIVVNILEALAQAPSPMGVTELAKTLGEPNLEFTEIWLHSNTMV